VFLRTPEFSTFRLLLKPTIRSSLKHFIMEELLVQPKRRTAEENVRAYFETHDVQYVAEDATFKLVFTGEEHHGRDAVSQLLSFFYQVAFEAHAEPRKIIITETQAVAEADFVGKHVGELAGLPPTQRDVRVPFAVVYDLENALIKEARIYFPMDVLLKQLT
jgi:predicted ester cyclase